MNVCDDSLICDDFPASLAYHEGCEGTFCAHDICQGCGAYRLDCSTHHVREPNQAPQLTFAERVSRDLAKIIAALRAKAGDA